MVKSQFVYLLGFGSNLGDKTANLSRGFELLKKHVNVLKVSEWVQTAPLTSPDYDTRLHEPYLNFVCEVTSLLPPQRLYENIKTIEDAIGHNRSKKWEPRHIDIDVLFCEVGLTFGSGAPYLVAAAGEFFVPHPGFWQRDFLQRLVASLGIPSQALAKHT